MGASDSEPLTRAFARIERAQTHPPPNPSLPGRGREHSPSFSGTRRDGQRWGSVTSGGSAITDPDRPPERETTIIETDGGGGGGGGAVIGVVLVIVVLAILFYLFGGQLLGTRHTNLNVNISGPAKSG